MSNAASASGADDEITALQDKLDGFWARYLTHLDEYDRAQKAIQQAMGSGFLSLAQANFKSQDRRRYGKDFYDERTKASRRCRVHDASEGRFQVEMTKTSFATAETAQSGNDEPKQQPSPPSTPAAEVNEPVDHNKAFCPEDEKASDETAVQSSSVPDPLHWFGILVPSELRCAQRSFGSAMQEPLEKAVNASRCMRQVEAEVNKTRKAIKKADKVSAA